jgi:hypothetical protein
LGALRREEGVPATAAVTASASATATARAAVAGGTRAALHSRAAAAATHPESTKPSELQPSRQGHGDNGSNDVFSVSVPCPRTHRVERQ